MEKETRLKELKDKMSSVGGYFGLTKEEKKEYSELSRALGIVKPRKEKKSKPVEIVDNDLATDTEEDLEVAKAIDEFEKVEAKGLETLSIESHTAETVKNDLWNIIKDGAARAAILSINPDLPLIDELNRIKNDRRITVEGSYAGHVQNYINKLTK